MQPLTRDPNKKHEKSELEILYEEALKEIKKYGTSEGALLGWDTRGRGRKDDEKEPKTRHTVADYKVVQHPKYKPEQFKTYDPKLSNIKYINSQMKDETLPTVATEAEKLNLQLTNKNLKIDDFTIKQMNKQSVIAQYAGVNNEMDLNYLVFVPEYQKQQQDSAKYFYDENGFYNNAIDPIIINHPENLAEAALLHETYHAIAYKYNVDNGYKVEQFDKVIEAYKAAKKERDTKMGELQAKRRGSYWMYSEEEEKIKAAFRPFVTKLTKEQNKPYTTPQFNKIIKEEKSKGWKLPTTYSRTDKPEALAECGALHDNGYDDLLTPRIIEYLEYLKRSVRDKK